SASSVAPSVGGRSRSLVSTSRQRAMSASVRSSATAPSASLHGPPTKQPIAPHAPASARDSSDPNPGAALEDADAADVVAARGASAPRFDRHDATTGAAAHNGTTSNARPTTLRFPATEPVAPPAP